MYLPQPEGCSAGPCTHLQQEQAGAPLAIGSLKSPERRERGVKKKERRGEGAQFIFLPPPSLGRFSSFSSFLLTFSHSSDDKYIVYILTDSSKSVGMELWQCL